MWWREALEDLARDKVRKHPIIQSLKSHIQYGELDADLLVVMVENRFSEFFEVAKNFQAFIEQRRIFLQPYYMNTYLALRGDDIPDNFAAFLGFDIIGCLQNLDFYKTRELIPFRGKVDPAALDALLNIGPKTSSPYFRGLRALALWHYKRLARVDFAPGKINPGHHHPGKILSLWRSKAG